MPSLLSSFFCTSLTSEKNPSVLVEAIMRSIRLPKDFENKLSGMAEIEKTTKSEIIMRDLRRYFESYAQQTAPFELVDYLK